MRFIRIALSPIVFILVLMLLLAGLLFPTSIIIMMSIWQLIASPFVGMFRIAGSDIEYSDGFITYSNYYAVNYILGITIILWVPFYAVIQYIKTGRLLVIEEM